MDTETLVFPDMVAEIPPWTQFWGLLFFSPIEIQKISVQGIRSKVWPSWACIWPFRQHIYIHSIVLLMIIGYHRLPLVTFGYHLLPLHWFPLGTIIGYHPIPLVTIGYHLVPLTQRNSFKGELPSKMTQKRVKEGAKKLEIDFKSILIFFWI